MKILILNVGSSSVKYEVFLQDKSILKGIIQRIENKKGFSAAIKSIISELKKNKIEADVIGHRVVHGGSIENTSRINNALLKRIEKVKDLAPLHVIPELHTIKMCLKLFKCPQYAVFDTAFHQSMPEKAFTYAIPNSVAKRYGIRRYGFHGISHEYVAKQACIILEKDIRTQKIITCHLGNGCSICAVNNGKSIDTSMGFTPLEGLVMGTRSGDIDPAIVVYLMGKGYGKEKLYSMLNHESGLLGLCGKIDFRDVMKSKSDRAKLAIDVFVYRLIKYIGAYAAAMNGVDLIVFTGGIGENSPYIRNRVLNNLTHLNISKKNIVVVKTDEAKNMARKIIEIL